MKNKSKVKFYVEDVFHKKVVTASDSLAAAVKFIDFKLKGNFLEKEKKLSVDSISDESDLALSEWICVSPWGFTEDAMEYAPEDANKMSASMILTSRALGCHGPIGQEIADEMTEENGVSIEDGMKFYVFSIA